MTKDKSLLYLIHERKPRPKEGINLDDYPQIDKDKQQPMKKNTFDELEIEHQIRTKS